MGVPTSEVGYTSAMPRREDHEVRKGHVRALDKEKYIHNTSGIRTRDPSKWVTAEVRLRPRGHRDRHLHYLDLKQSFSLWQFTIRYSVENLNMRLSQYKKFYLLLSTHILTYTIVWVEFESMISLHAVLACKLAIRYENFDRFCEFTL